MRRSGKRKDYGAANKQERTLNRGWLGAATGQQRGEQNEIDSPPQIGTTGAASSGTYSSRIYVAGPSLRRYRARDRSQRRRGANIHGGRFKTGIHLVKHHVFRKLTRNHARMEEGALLKEESLGPGHQQHGGGSFPNNSHMGSLIQTVVHPPR